MIDYKKTIEDLRHADNLTADHKLLGVCARAAAAIEALQAQLPKRGEWVWDDKRCIYVCSVCGSPKARENMDRQIIKEQAYFYSCGAKMEE